VKTGKGAPEADSFEVGDFMDRVKARRRSSFYNPLLDKALPVVKKEKREVRFEAKSKSAAGTVNAKLKARGENQVRALVRLDEVGKRWVYLVHVDKLGSDSMDRGNSPSKSGGTTRTGRGSPAESPTTSGSSTTSGGSSESISPSAPSPT
jgi:hypothetical protein